MNRIGFLTFLLSAVTLFPQLAQAQGQSNRAWRNDVFLYGLASSISGDAQLGGPVQLPVDVSFSDILDNLQMGFMGGYRGSSERFSVVADVIYLGLGNSSDTGLVRRADLDQLIVDVTGGYRFSSIVEAFAGLRVTDLSTKVGLEDPVITELEGSDTFYDPVVGVRVLTPLSQNGRWWLQARATLEASEPPWISPGRPWPMSDSSLQSGSRYSAVIARSDKTSRMLAGARGSVWT